VTSPTTLVKGQNAPLTSTSVQITVNVQAPTDLSALLVTDSGKVRTDADFVFFNQPDGPGVHCVKDGAEWLIRLDMAQIPAEIKTVRVVVNLQTPGQRFGQVAPPVAKIADDAGNTIAQYEVTGLSQESIMVAVELYRRGADWKVRAVGQGYAGGLADLISDHGVSVDDASGQQPSAPTTISAPPAAPPPPEEPDTGGAFGHLQPAAPQQPAAAPPPAMQQPAAPSPAPPAAAFPPPQQGVPAPSAPPPAQQFPPPPTGAPAAFPPPVGYPQQAGFPPPSEPPAGGPHSAHQDEVGLSPHRPVSLQKGQRVSLRKETGGDLTMVRMGLGWDPIKKRSMFGNRDVDIDLDASAVMFADRQLADVAFYNNLRSKDGSVQHQGDNRTGAGEGDDETVLIDLNRVGAHITSIVFVVTSYEGQTFEQVQNAFCRLIDHNSGAELARYTLTGGMPFTGMVMAKVYRDGAGWKMQAIGEGINARTPSDSFPQLPRFL